MFHIFKLGRPDVLPAHDLGIRRGFQIAYRKRKMPNPEQLAKYGGTLGSSSHQRGQRITPPLV